MHDTQGKKHTHTPVFLILVDVVSCGGNAWLIFSKYVVLKQYTVNSNLYLVSITPL